MITSSSLLILSFCMFTVLTTKLVQPFYINNKSAFQRLLPRPRHRTVLFPFKRTMTKDSDTTTTTTTTTLKNSARKSGLPEEDTHQHPLILSLRHELQCIDQSQQQDNDDDDDEKKKKKILLILASASPRRREILDMMGLQGRFHVMPSPLDESALQQELTSSTGNNNNNEKYNSHVPPMDYARILAEEKARVLAESIRNTQQQPSSSLSTILILGSDTIVDLNGVILEKPKDAIEAHDMLSRLSGAEHAVHTGVAIYRVVTTIQTTTTTNDSNNDNNNKKREALSSLLVEKVTSFTDTARVRFAQLSPVEIEAYVETKEPMDKAGSYGIQGMGGQFVTNVQGDFFTVMGLPMHRTSRALAQAVLSLETLP